MPRVSGVLLPFLYLLACTDAAAAEPVSTWTTVPRFTLYSESSYQSGIDQIVSDTKTTLSVARWDEWLDLYGGISVCQELRPSPDSYGGDNLLSVYPGISSGALRRAWNIPIQLFAEYRRILTVNTAGQKSDPRYGAWLYHWVEPSDPVFFIESYGEVVHTERIVADWVAAGWVKGGHRFKIEPALHWDPYLELAIKRDTALFRGENTQEFRSGARIGYQPGAFGASLSMARAWGGYARGLEGSVSSEYTEWRGLLAISGQL